MKSFVPVLIAFAGLLASVPAARAQLNVTAVLQDYGSEMAADPVANRLYFSDGQQVTVLDGQTHQPVKTYPAPGLMLNIDPSAGRLFAFRNGIVVADAASGAILATVPLHKTLPSGPDPWVTQIRVNPVTGRVYFTRVECADDIAQSCASSLDVMDGKSLAILNSAPVLSYPGIDLDPTLDRVYFTGVARDVLTVMDGDLNTVASVPLPATSQGLEVDPVRHRVYVRTMKPVPDSPTDTKLVILDGRENRALRIIEAFHHIGMRVDPGSGGMWLLGIPSKAEHRPIRTRYVHLWDGESVDAGGRAAYAGDHFVPELFDLMDVNPATGRTYGRGLVSHKILVFEHAAPVDTVPPTVTATFSRPPDVGGWYKGRLEVTLTTADDPGGMGVYGIIVPHPITDDPDNTRVAIGGTAGVRLSSTAALHYSALDYAGNVTAGSISAKVDTSAPQTTAVVASPGGVPRVTLAATDGEGSGVTGTVYRVDDGPDTTYAGPFSLDPNRPHTVTYYSKDLVGYVEHEHTVSLRRAGDLNDDRRFDVGDVVLVLAYAVSGGPENDPATLIAGDWDGNGKLEVTDAVLLLKKLVGLEPAQSS